MSIRTRRFSLFFALGCLLLGSCLVFSQTPSAKAAGPTVQVWLTTSDGSNQLTPQANLTFGSNTGNSSTINVNEYQELQQMTGFGAAVTDSSWTSPGQRVFNVGINGSNVLSNFDIIGATGAKDTAIVKQFTATADSNGQISIQFSSVTNYAEVNGIEIIPTSSGSITTVDDSVQGSGLNQFNYIPKNSESTHPGLSSALNIIVPVYCPPYSRLTQSFMEEWQ